VKAIGKALGKEPKIVHFNPKDFDKKAFPFRCCRAGRPESPLCDAELFIVLLVQLSIHPVSSPPPQCKRFSKCGAAPCHETKQPGTVYKHAV
jgi:hypothetical protein